jgi:tetratricopeptide (TPR) repeat protein
MINKKIFGSLMGLFLSASPHNNLLYHQELFSPQFFLSQKAIPFNPSEEIEEQLIEGMDQGMKGNYLGAIQIFSRLIQAYPHYADAYYNRGLAKAKLGDTQGAIADYNQAIKIDTNLAEAYQERGNIWLELKNKDKAILDFKKAAELYKKQDNTIGYEQVITNISTLEKP